jgi:hypothetical protein
LATSGSIGSPVGATSTWRGIGFSISQCSTLTTGHTANALPSGSATGLRSIDAT